MYKQIVNFSFIVLASVAVCVTIALGFFVIFNENKTLGLNFIDNQNGNDFVSEIVDGNTADNELLQQYENRYFIEANLYDNTNGNGIVLQEMKLNYFTSPTLNVADYYSTGMQSKNLISLYAPENFGGSSSWWDYILKSSILSHFISNKNVYELNYTNNFNTYSTVAGLTANWKGSQTPLNRDTYYIISIDNEPYRIKLDGKLDTKYDNRVIYKPWTWFDKGGSIINYNFCDIFTDVISGIKTNNLGTGTHFAVLDLSKYFTTIEKFIPNSVGGDWVPQKADIVKNYVAIKFHYSNNGAVRSSQSMFGIIDNNPKYDIAEERYDTTYWQERVQYALTNKDLEYRYSSVYDGYFVSLSQDTIRLFKTMPRAEVTFSIDLDYNDKNIIGFDYNAFKNFRLKQILLYGSGEFYLMNDCLLNTHIEILKKESAITLNGISDSGASFVVGGV